jgi:hypothetical protein
MRRTFLDCSAAALAFTLAGTLAGGALGFAAPGLYCSLFHVESGDNFDPVRIGLGTGTALGFLTGAVVATVGLVCAVLPGLSRQMVFARGLFRPSFAGLLFLIAVVALALASLRSPSRIGAELWFVVSALALASAAVAALSQPSEQRGFAAGFAVLGWCYVLLSLHSESRAQLPTSRLLPLLERQISGTWRVGVQYLSLEMGPFPARQRGTYWEPIVTNQGGIPGSLQIDEVQPDFRRIGHSLFALLMGAVGGVIGEVLLDRRHRASASLPDDSRSSRSSTQIT